MTQMNPASRSIAAAAAPGFQPKRIVRLLLSVFGFAFLILFALIEILPFIFTVATSFKCLPAVNAYPAALIPTPPFFVQCRETDAEGRVRVLSADETASPITFNPTLEGYEQVFQAQLGRWLVNTALFAGSIMILRLILASLAGYALARLKFPGNRLFFTAMLGTMMIPAIVILIPRFIILQQLGLLNSLIGAIIPLMVDGFSIFLMKQFFESIPDEIEEAAMVDGANRFIMFFRVILPMATPALTALAIFSFQGAWNNFLDVLIVLGGNQEWWTLPLGLSYLRGSTGEALIWNEFLAGSVVTTLPMAIIFFLFQRYFVEGVNYSGLAGQ
jgi:multiple sugar transport system permease protein